MVNFKKFLAVALAATMVIGGSVTSFAADTGSGSGSGAGDSEGHVDKDIMNFVLPTTSDTAFKYTVDAERLIQETNAARYGEDFTFPNSDTDTGVYFLTGEKEYSNTSTVLKAVNKGAVDAFLTVDCKVTAGAKDIALANAALTADDDKGTDAKLYLAANVGGATQILSTTSTPVKVQVPGVAANYETVYDKDAKEYKFQTKSGGLDPWKAVEISVTGAATKGIAVAADTTAPQITLTWSYAKYDATTHTDATSGAAAVNYVEGPQVTLSAAGLITMSGLTAADNYVSLKLTYDGTDYDLGSNKNVQWTTTGWTKEDGGTMTCQLNDAWLALFPGKSIKVTLNTTSGAKTVTTSFPSA